MQVICRRDVPPEPGTSGHCGWSLRVFNMNLFSDFCREMSHPPPLLSPQNAPHIALGPHLRPPFLGVPSALCQTPGECLRNPCSRPGEAGRAKMQAVTNRRLAKQPRHVFCVSVTVVLTSPLFCTDRSRLPWLLSVLIPTSLPDPMFQQQIALPWE